MLDLVPRIAALILILWAVAEDFRGFKIPNRLIVTGFAAGTALLAVRMIAGRSVWEYIVGFAAGFAAMLILYILRAVGAGDVKLFGILGMMLGAQLVIKLVIVSFVVGLFIGIAEMCFKRTAMVEVGKAQMRMHGFHYAAAVLVGYALMWLF